MLAVSLADSSATYTHALGGLGIPVLIEHGARIRRLGIDQARSACSACFSGVATLTNAVKHVGVADRNSYLELMARVDFR